MSIEAAAKELTKEIERLQKEAERLTRLRDSLQPGVTVSAVTNSGPAAKKRAAKRGSTKNAAPLKKRVLSPEGRRNIIQAAKRRWALKRRATANEKKKGSVTSKKVSMAEK